MSYRNEIWYVIIIHRLWYCSWLWGSCCSHIMTWTFPRSSEVMLCINMHHIRCCGFFREQFRIWHCCNKQLSPLCRTGIGFMLVIMANHVPNDIMLVIKAYYLRGTGEEYHYHQHGTWSKSSDLYNSLYLCYATLFF